MPTNPVRAIVCDTANKHLVITIERSACQTSRPAGARTYTNPTPASRRRIAQLTENVEPKVEKSIFTYALQPA